MCLIRFHYYIIARIQSWDIMMKSGLFLLAGATLLGSANCGMHKLKLQKVPLAEQQVYVDPASQASSLAMKYSSQKFMGLHPQSRGEIFKDTSVQPVPVTNFRDSQCMTPIHAGFWTNLTNDFYRFLRDRYRYPTAEFQSRIRCWIVQSLGTIGIMPKYCMFSPF